MRVLTIKELMLLGILASTIHVTVPYRDGRFVREVREGKKPAFSDGLRMAGAGGFEPRHRCGHAGQRKGVAHMLTATTTTAQLIETS